MDKRNLSMMTDLYQLTMMNGYSVLETGENTAVFDMFFRPNGQISYAVYAGLEQAVEYIENLHFSGDDLDYLKKTCGFADKFLDALRHFKFTGDIYSVGEGTIVFPYEPLLTVRAPLWQAQLIETALLNILNHQTLIATKASKVKNAAGKAVVSEFGLRRAQGPDAGVYGARASIIGGCGGTSNVLTGQMFEVPIKGTMSHSWVMSFDNELEAFEKFAEIYPDNCLLLVDTYDTLKSGLPNAIKVFTKLKEAGHKPTGIRLDSGDLAYLSKKARAMLDGAGFKDAIIFASCDLDESVIASLNLQGAKIDAYGVGTRLITSSDMPSLGGVYKLAEIEYGGVRHPRMKFSDTPEKMTNPGYKTLYRVYDEQGKAFADVISLFDEEIDGDKPLKLTHPTLRYKSTTLTKFSVKKLLQPVILGGKTVYKPQPVMKLAKYNAAERKTFWEEYLRNINPEIYKVNLSDELYELKKKMIGQHLGGYDEI